MVGRILEASKHFNHADYLDITDGLVFNATVYPKLYNVIEDEKWSSMTTEQIIDTTYGISAKSIDIDKDTMIVGQSAYTVAAQTSAGAVSIYKRTGTTWTLEQDIPNPSPTENDKFGTAVGVHGDICIISQNTALALEKVHVYTRTAGVWTLEQTIGNPNGAVNDQYGHSAGIYGETIVVGARYGDLAESDSGTIYVYTRSGTTWTLEQAIGNPNPTLGPDHMGESLEIYKDTIVVGASRADTLVDDVGTAFVFTRSGTTWTLEQELPCPDSTTQYGFYGESTSVYEDILVIGNPNLNRVFIYRRQGQTWVLEQRIDSPDTADKFSFGKDVSIYQDTVIIGDQDWTDSGLESLGKIYIYKYSNSTWSLNHALSSPTEWSSFGSALVINGPEIVISGAGNAYVYTIPQTNYNVIQPRETGNPDTKFFVKAK